MLVNLTPVPHNIEGYPIKLPRTRCGNLERTSRPSTERIFNENSKSKIGEPSFCTIAAKIWNLAPQEVRDAKTIFESKRLIKKYCKRHYLFSRIVVCPTVDSPNSSLFRPAHRDIHVPRPVHRDIRVPDIHVPRPGHREHSNHLNTGLVWYNFAVHFNQLVSSLTSANWF